MHKQQALQLEANLTFSANGQAMQGPASERDPGAAQGSPHHPTAEGFLAFVSCFTTQVRFNI